jgi:dihydroorotase
MDVLLRDGKVEKVASGIRPEEGWAVENLKGKYLSAGWIDLHAHVAGDLFHPGLEPDRDAGVNTGVTTVIDAGSAGAMSVKALKRYVLDPSTTRVVVFMNAANAMGSSIKGAYTDLRNMDMGLSMRAIAAFPDLIKGIKVMASVTQVGDNGIEPVKIAKKVARLAGLPLMAHIGNAPPVLEDVLNLLDAGDIVTHSFHGKPGGLLDRKGLPLREAIAARERGVWFDVGHGRASFCYETFKKCVAAGFPPDSISTDLHTGNVRGAVVDMGTTMSKFLALGFSLKEVIDLSTRRPAVILGAPLGTLTPGTTADVTVFSLVNEEAVLRDAENATMKVSQLIRPVMTVKGGAKAWAA